MLDIREGWTERIRYALTKDGVPLILTSMTVVLVGTDAIGTASFAGSVGIDDAPAGVVYLDPTATDLLASRSPYKLRWKVTDAAGKIVYFPRAEPMIWKVSNP